MTSADFKSLHKPDVPGATWVMTVPVVSTVHIKHSDAEKLDSMDWPVVGDLGTGWLLRLVPNADTAFNSCSRAMREMLEAFKAMGFDYLRLDADGVRLTDLQTFNW